MSDVQKSPQSRLEHPYWLVLLLGGSVGAGICLTIACFLHVGLAWNPLLAMFLGTLGCQVFHMLYYTAVFFQTEGHWRLSILGRCVIFLEVATTAPLLLWLFLKAGIDFPVAVVAVLFVLSVFNVMLIRIVSFSSARLAEIEYHAMEGSFYDDQTDMRKVGRFRAWFHRSRFDRLTRFVDEHYQAGKRIADLGCGNCWWNAHNLAVTGVDVNEKMLIWAMSHQRIHDYRLCADLTRTGLPNTHFDIVVMSETLEHLLDLREVLAEVRRIVKPDGVFLITVPYDFVMSPFFLLFNVHCFVEGFIKGSRYHQYRCGHINHFDKRRLRRLLRENGFQLQKLFVVNGLTLYASAVPDPAAPVHDSDHSSSISRTVPA